MKTWYEVIQKSNKIRSIKVVRETKSLLVIECNNWLGTKYSQTVNKVSKESVYFRTKEKALKSAYNRILDKISYMEGGVKHFKKELVSFKKKYNIKTRILRHQ